MWQTQAQTFRPNDRKPTRNGHHQIETTKGTFAPPIFPNIVYGIDYANLLPWFLRISDNKFLEWKKKNKKKIEDFHFDFPNDADVFVHVHVCASVLSPLRM